MYFLKGFVPSDSTVIVRIARLLHTRNWNAYKIAQPNEHVLHLQLNRPANRNAMGSVFWKETKDIFQMIQTDPIIRAIVLSGQGKAFSSGMDLSEFPKIIAEAGHRDPSRCGLKLRQVLENLQETFTCLERCDKPVIAAIHGACVGAAVDMICAADIRYCSRGAWFQIKEIELGIAADIGTLQRLPLLVGSESLARELIFTARRFDAPEALQSGFVSRLFDDPDQLVVEAIETAKRIAQLSPIAVQTSKRSLIYSRDHGVMDGLRHLVDLNQVMLQSQDVIKAITASIKKTDAEFDDL